MFIPYRSALALGLSALVLAGCGDSSDSSASADSGSNSGGGNNIEEPVDPQPVIVPPPQAEQTPEFIVRPYLQAPGPDTMTVMFETENSEPEVWARPFGSGQEFHKVSGEVHSDDGLVYRAPLTALESNTLYEYYVLTHDAESALRVTQPFAFKTWPNAGDDVSEARFIAISDTQLDRTIYEVVLNNVVTDGFMTEECDGTKPETCAENIAAITISGDVVQTGGNRGNWRNQLFGRMAEITPYVPLVTVPGNHDYYSNAELQLYRSYMAPPENGSVGYEDHWYYLDYLDLRLVGLDSYPISGAHGKFNADTLAVQRQWLKETLRDAEIQQKQFVMGMFHHGCLSEMWNAGESIGTCELVAELEQYSERTGAVTGHFFGHTHSYSRGQSQDTSHLWLNAASASGYIEPLDDAGFQNSQISDYDTFEVSRSEFGYSVLTYRFGQDSSLTLQRKKGGYDGDTDFNIVDEVTFAAASNSNLPQATAGTGELALADVELAIQVGAPEQVHEVQWQVSETADFSGPVFDVWGNDTRRHNLFYDEASQVGGDLYQGFEAIDTQQGADIFRLDLSALLARKTVRPGGDDHYRWNKRYSSQNTHTSSYDDYAGQNRPVLALKPGTTYHWRSRVRDTAMNWSTWSNSYSFTMEGTRTENLLVNGGGEAGDLTGWTITSGAMNVVVGAQNGLAAAEGERYFTGRGFGNPHPDDCCTEAAYQLIDVSGYAATIDAGQVYLEAEVAMTTWNGVDEPEFRVEVLDAGGQPMPWSGAASLTTKAAKNWDTMTINGLLPTGARSIKVHIGGTRKQGNDNDVYFDGMSINLLY
ncbi:metallophosphoesterase family protein [Marinobacter zhejiangensis]|uniref:3',5'-cyclic AMP phosphodiesterase CpdA n=1 Tax=Marinobacter zhejiangensis TaxID=488535 RepID=A0A1I4NCQ6_9GAMM|nr:metallophosphoesterase [Marinobacter zhejiangensis]SFM13087.1 3',5'-cyclic AMP phosphodiesterase CpdA [Marinobacter zhejiangensis]